MSKVATGARLELRIGTIPVIFANNVSYEYNIEIEKIKGIDKLEVEEFAEIGVSVTFQASHFRVAFNTAVTHGWIPKLGVLLQQPELTAIITDKKPATANSTAGRIQVLRIKGLKCIGRSGNIDARGAWIETLKFVGRSFSDEEGE